MTTRFVLSLIGAMAVSLSATAAMARPDTRTMSCDEVRSLIIQNGAIVLTTGQHTFDRFVAARPFCDYPNIPTRMSVPTTDTNSCIVYNCQRSLYDTSDN
ncbi:hypothetical protein [Mesorhizobium sp. CAU 1732]|uniref:hypothetical protein n=1 Tax=Mesorhizobium sp. CAU 1732 TaxID=3140358 RepID=UPI003260B243